MKCDKRTKRFNICCALLLLHQEYADKDVDRVGCVSLGRSINDKVLATIQFVHDGIGIEVEFDKKSSSTSTPVWITLHYKFLTRPK